MYDYNMRFADMGWGMGIYMALLTIVTVLAIAALIKYLRS